MHKYLVYEQSQIFYYIKLEKIMTKIDILKTWQQITILNYVYLKSALKHIKMNKEITNVKNQKSRDYSITWW